MKNKNICISEKDHIIRYCKPRLYDAVKKEASLDVWKLEKDESYLSCLWFESCNSLKKIKEDFYLSFYHKSGLTKGAFPVQCIEDILEIGCKHDLRNIILKYEGSLSNPAHSGIYNTSNDTDFLTDMIFETNRILKKQNDEDYN